MRKIPVLLTIGWLFSAHVAAASEYVHPKLKSKQASVRSVVVVPPQVATARNSAKGAESMVAEAEAAARNLAAAIARVLRDRGLQVVEDAFDSSTQEPRENAETQQAIANLQVRYDSIAVQLAKHPKDVNKGRFSLGDDLAALTAGIEGDALVFVRAQGIWTTKGAALLQGGLIGLLASGGRIACDVAVVDALTGDVLFFSRTGAKGSLEEAGAKLEEPLMKSFRKFPVGS